MPIKIEVALGTYIIDSQDDITSIRITATEHNEKWIWKDLFNQQNELYVNGELDGFTWIRDVEDACRGFVSVLRQWARADATRFIPKEE